MLSIDYRNLFTRTLNSKSLQYNKHRAERRAQLYTSLSDYTICVCFVTLSFSLAHLIPNPCSTTNTGQSAGHSYTSLSDYTLYLCLLCYSFPFTPTLDSKSLQYNKHRAERRESSCTPARRGAIMELRSCALGVGVGERCVRLPLLAATF